MVESGDPCFKADQCTMWIENVKCLHSEEDATAMADDKITALTADHTKLQFEADALSLARDAAQLARLFNEESKSERAMRVAKVCHLRQENQIGSALTSKHMQGCCHHLAGSMSELQEELTKVGVD